MCCFSQISPDNGLDALVEILARASEFSDVVLRRGERKRLNELNKSLRFPIKGRIKTGVDKRNCLLQVRLVVFIRNKIGFHWRNNSRGFL